MMTNQPIEITIAKTAKTSPAIAMPLGPGGSVLLACTMPTTPSTPEAKAPTGARNHPQTGMRLTMTLMIPSTRAATPAPEFAGAVVAGG